MSILTLLSAVAFAQSDSFISFIEGRDAVNEIIKPPPAPCVPRLPAFQLSVNEGTYSKFAVKSMDTDCRETFRAAVHDFTDVEKDLLTKYVVLIDSVIDAELPALGKFPWRFAVIGDSAHFGVPNSNEHIILTDSLLRNMAEWMENESSMMFVSMEMLISEKVRVLQASKSEQFERFYKDIWGFRKINKLSFDDALVHDEGMFFSRIPQNEWVIKVTPKGKEYIMPALMLRDDGTGTAGTALCVAITIDSTSKGFFPRKSKSMPVDYKDLRLIAEYRKMFPLSERYYHPSDLSADLIAKYLVMKYVSGHYKTAPGKISDYSRIDVLMKRLGGK
jgi:hypothetical protein